MLRSCVSGVIMYCLAQLYVRPSRTSLCLMLVSPPVAYMDRLHIICTKPQDGWGRHCMDIRGLSGTARTSAWPKLS
ncbi:hypothetical protein GGR58DRAFT_462316 [Xylaria digitata]|nr:hypothetical protein GGR58DRAFT_462316 [Xylaria digitata]